MKRVTFRGLLSVKKLLALNFLLVVLPQMVMAFELTENIDLYGSLRPEIIFRKLQGQETARRMDDGYSRIGMKGSLPVGDDMDGFFKAERRVSANDGEDDGAVRADNNEFRQVHVGLRSAMGSLSIGRHYGVYYDVIDDEIDRHRSHYSDAVVLGDLFVSNSMVLRSPTFQVSQSLRWDATLLVEFNDLDASGNVENERLEFAMSASLGGFKLNMAYVDAPVHDGLVGASFSWSHNMVTLAGVAQEKSLQTGGEDQLFSLALDVDLSAKHRVRLAATGLRPSGGNDTDLLLIGIDHRFPKYAVAYLEGFRRSSDLLAATDEKAVIAGLHINF
jgi:predicted porin